MAASKEQKEAFVTGHDGTTPWEILLICIAAPVGIMLFQIVPKSVPKWQKVVLEGLFLIFPIAVCQTTLLYPWGIVLLCLEGLSATIFSIARKEKRATDQISSTNFVSAYRSTVMVLTFIAILAVDFHVFPRRYAKTETQGYSLMDLGAGSFVMAAALVSSRARGKTRPDIFRTAKRMVPLLGLGLIRLLTTKGLEYQEHVSEYGVQWNFFFTLAVISPFAAIFPSGWLSPCILIGTYQYCLSNYNLQEFIENAPRICLEGSPFSCSFIAANREGILGVVGYLVIFLLGEQIATKCIWTTQGFDIGKNLYRVAALLWTVLAVLTQVLEIPVSRRSTNASFCAWSLAHNTLILAFLSSVTETVPPIFEAVNRHGLLVFVVANLLTGLTNLTINTLEVSDARALVVLVFYLCAVGCFSLLCDYIFLNKMPTVNHSKRD